MRILAIDPGFERVGIAIIDPSTGSGQEKLLYSDCFKTKSSLPFSKRLHNIGQEIDKIIKKYKPDSLAIETLIFNTNQKTAMRVSEARGVVIYEASRRGINVYEYTPLQVKIAVTGYGRATKEQVASMVEQLIELASGKKRLDDEYDAIAIGLTHCAHAR